MINIRRDLFETNSSSTHAIVVSKDSKEHIKMVELFPSWETYDFSFGRETFRPLYNWDLKLAYVYIVLLQINQLSDVISPTVDLEKFKSRVIYTFYTTYNEVISSCNYKDTNPPDNDTIPENIFKILDFIDQKERGIIPIDAKPDFDFDTYKFENILSDYSCSYVDHIEYFYLCKGDDRRCDYPCVRFLENILSDDDYLKRFLFSRESYITIGGDEYQGYYLRTIGFEDDYRDEKIWESKVSEYSKTHDVYFKGN